MSRLRLFAIRLLNLFRRGPFERELDAELQAYVELDVDENIRRGMAPQEARRTALARAGGLEMIKEQCRDVHRFRAADDLWRDFQFGFRRLRARPILAGVALAVLAIGIGANTVVFSLVDALLLRPSPGADPHRLVVVSTSHFSSGRPGLNSYPDYLDIRESTRDVFEHVTAASLTSVGVRFGGETRVFSVNYFCRLAPTIFAGSGRRESRSTTMTPVGRVGVACDVQSGVENALPRRCTVAPLLARVFHAAGAVHRLLGFRSIPAFRRSTVGGRGAAADPEHVPGEQAPRGISGGTGPCGSSGRRTQACSA